MALSTFPESAGADDAHVVILGGGITGLTAAYQLSQHAAAGAAVRWTLVERDTRLGGKIVTERTNGFVIEGGPDSFVTHKPWALELVHELGLTGEVIGTNPTRHTTYVLQHGQPLPMPEGLFMIAPTRWLPFMRSPLFSLRGKLRMALEPFIPPRRSPADETLASFVRRRFGAEALTKLGEPMMAAIHSCDAEQQSMQATFPRFQQLEAQYGSIIRGFRAQRRARKLGTSQREAAFVSLRGGIGALVDALVPRLDGCTLTGQTAVAIEQDAAGYHVLLDGGETLLADVVVVTTPAAVAADLLEPLRPEEARLLRQVPHVSTVTVSLAYRRADLRLPLDGFGLVIPRSEGRAINACTLTSLKFAHRAPDDHLLVRAFVGGTHRAELLDLDDERLLALVGTELRATLGIDAAPVLGWVYRWPDGNPQYHLGHRERVAQITALMPEGVLLAGCTYHGVGIPDCIRQGREAAQQALALIGSRQVAINDL